MSEGSTLKQLAFTIYVRCCPPGKVAFAKKTCFFSLNVNNISQQSIFLDKLTDLIKITFTKLKP
jgi:hypothetical protein